jgi:phosphatidate phosphatase PAH1
MHLLLILLAMTLFACAVQAPPQREKPAGPNTALEPASAVVSKPRDTATIAANGKPKPEPAPVYPEHCDTGAKAKWTPCTGDTFVPDHALVDWTHWTTSTWMVVGPNPHHRGVDALLAQASAQRLEAKFTYGPVHKNLVHELVDVYVERSCGSWEYLGESTTSNDDDNGSEDDGGRVYFYVPESQKLTLGSYRVKMVVKGDHSDTTFLVHVLPEHAPIVVSDIDGTITLKEWDGLVAWFDSNYPDPRPGSEDLFAAYHAKGFYILYLTARPELLTGGTREWFADNLFPQGAFHLSRTDIGEHGDSARSYKEEYLQDLVDRGFDIKAVYGNKDTDLDAYLGAGVAASAVTLVSGQYTGDLKGARMVDGWLQEAVNVGCAPALP